MHKKLDEILYTTEFGLIDDNLELVNFDEKQVGKTHTVWVMKSLFDAEEDKNEPRTVYQVVGVGDEAPKSRVEVGGILGETICEWDGFRRRRGS